MAREDEQRRVILTILWTSILLTMLSVYGVYRGTLELSNQPIADMTDQGEDAAEVAALLERLASNPLRRPLAAANVALSVLVLIGSFMLSWRRKLACWWIKQAVTAKVLWIVVDTASRVHHLQNAPDGPELSGAELRAELSRWLIVAGVGAVALHAWAAWRATRPEVQAFVAGTKPQGRL